MKAVIWNDLNSSVGGVGDGARGGSARMVRGSDNAAEKTQNCEINLDFGSFDGKQDQQRHGSSTEQ